RTERRFYVLCNKKSAESSAPLNKTNLYQVQPNRRSLRLDDVVPHRVTHQFPLARRQAATCAFLALVGRCCFLRLLVQITVENDLGDFCSEERLVAPHGVYRGYEVAAPVPLQHHSS